MNELSEAFRTMIREELKKVLAEIAPAQFGEWLSQQEAAKHCGVNVATIRNWHRQGLTCQRVGKVVRYRKSDLDNFMGRHTRKDPAARVAEILARRVG